MFGVCGPAHLVPSAVVLLQEVAVTAVRVSHFLRFHGLLRG